jgi:hypothetical protein
MDYTMDDAAQVAMSSSGQVSDHFFADINYTAII